MPRSENEMMSERLARVTMERDAAEEDLRSILATAERIRADCSRLISALIEEREQVAELRARLEPDH